MENAAKFHLIEIKRTERKSEEKNLFCQCWFEHNRNTHTHTHGHGHVFYGCEWIYSLSQNSDASHYFPTAIIISIQCAMYETLIFFSSSTQPQPNHPIPAHSLFSFYRRVCVRFCVCVYKVLFLIWLQLYALLGTHVVMFWCVSGKPYNMRCAHTKNMEL